MKILGKNTRKCFISLTVSLLLSFHVYPGGTRAFALSLEDESILGQRFLMQASRAFEFVDDDFANEYINALGHYLISPLEIKHFPYRFYIIKENDLNAFAGPGGHIFFLSGLIEAMDEVDQLASVVCHEIGHISARHLAKRIEQSKKLNLATLAGILAGILVGGQAATAIMVGSQAAAAQAQLSYSRSDERQADQLGFKYMDASGFDPSEMITAFRKLEAGQYLGGDRIPAYLLTHPGGPERMSNMETMLTDYTPKPANKEVVNFRRLYPFFRTVVRAESLDPQDAVRLFNKELEKDPDSALAHFGLGIVWKKKSEYSRAIDHFLKALKGQPESPPILRGLGEAYQLNGQDAEAIEVLEKALKIDDLDKSALFLLAVTYQSLEQYPKAIRFYQRLTVMRPVRNEVFYNLGMSYGREGGLALAHYNFGIYFRRLGRVNKAKYHFQKAEELSKGDPALRSRIQKAMERLQKKPVR